MAYRRFGSGLALVIAAWPLWSHAADKPAFRPPPPWVDVAPIPAAQTAADGPALQTLLDDNQSQLSPAGDAYYTRRVVKVIKTEGLENLTSETVDWSPDTESIVINTLAIHRGGQVIDLLKDHSKVLVLRRETGLELGMLDGRLTATRQIEGLQVGDEVDFAWTLSRRDPVMKGHSEDPEGLSSADAIGRYRIKMSWPSTDPVHWRTSAGMAQPTITTRDGRTELLVDATNIKAPDAPAGAPGRFAWVGRLEATSFKSWEEASATIWPLFDKAATLEPGSPIKAEAAAIAARDADPKARAFDALKLVEDKTRYFYVGTNDGGYIPAAADETWRRRFGDCKGKTVLLLSLLRELGVQAEPALVSTGFGDGLDQELPSFQRFDHVIVRAAIGGKVYWLDGTRGGDLGGVDQLQPPAWRWALPLNTGGSPLERIVQPPLDQPMMDLFMRVDASKGADLPAPTEIRVTLHGDGAIGYRAMVAKMSKDELQKILRHAYANSMAWIEPKSVTWHDDPQSNAFEIDYQGVAEIPWRDDPDRHAREFVLPASNGQANIFPRRDSGLNDDAPCAVAYPLYIRGIIEVALPNAGKGFTVNGGNVNETVAQYDLKRSAALEGEVARFHFSLKALAPEASVTEAKAANKELLRLGQTQELIRMDLAPSPAQPGAAQPGKGS